jgi:hypothetical protein
LGSDDKSLKFLFVFEARQKPGLTISKAIGRKAKLFVEGFGLTWKAA